MYVCMYVCMCVCICNTVCICNILCGMFHYELQTLCTEVANFKNLYALDVRVLSTFIAEFQNIKISIICTVIEHYVIAW